VLSTFALVLKRALKLDELKPKKVKGGLTNGRSIQLQAAHGSVRIPEIEFEDEGLIEPLSSDRWAWAR
jgi:hypothetical protein